MSKALHPWRRLTFRGRLAFAIALLLIVFGLGLVSIINAVSTGVATHTTTVVLDAKAPSNALTATSPVAVQQQTLHIVLLSSVGGLILFCLLGGAVAYVLSGRLLSSLRTIAAFARQTSGGTLDQRLIVPEASDELRDLALSFNTMLDRLERTFTQQRAFVSDAAHELRTPLAVLRTNLDIACRDAEQMPATFERLERAVTRLDHLVASLFLLSREESLPHGVPVPLGPLLEDVLADLAGLATEQGIVVQYEGDAAVSTQGDAVLLMHLFRNLVENALRYNRPQGHVTVRLGAAFGESIVAVSDTGIGISTLDQDDIFTRFYRVEASRARHKGGNGLGLAIVAHIVRQHGGTIAVNSVEGVGSTFTVRLPWASQKRGGPSRYDD